MIEQLLPRDKGPSPEGKGVCLGGGAICGVTHEVGASKNSVPLMITRCAGVLTPQAKVEVATKIWILPSTNNFSTKLLSCSFRPAW